jgi:REP element-mobilizing transposase RayT
MRSLRLKIDPRIQASATHLISRTNNGEWFFDQRSKTKLLHLIRLAAEFCGLDLLTYALMANHPHAEVLNPHWKKDPDDAELLRRYRVLNPGGPTKYRSKNLDVIAAHLAANTEFGIDWRRRQIAQMGDISQFMKIVKQRFTVWFNRTYKRTGTIWGGRFKSLLVHGNSGALLAMAAYIDLNPVRAGIVSDPKDYLFSGYGQAVSGNLAARNGIIQLTGAPNWDIAQAEYRKLLYAVAVKPRAKGRVLAIEEFDRVVSEKGKVPLAQALRLRIRSLTDGVVFGTKEFIAAHESEFATANRRKRKAPPKPLPLVTDWGGLSTLRGLRRP